MTLPTRTPVLSPGVPFPLGASVHEHGVNFAVYSEHATAVTVCLFGETGGDERQFPLPQRTGHVWHGSIDGVGAGQRYGLRVDGPWDPNAGHRFNRAKLLVDPYARALDGAVDWSGPVHGHVTQPDRDDLTADFTDDAAFVPKCVVVGDDFDWNGDVRPATPLARTLIYEVHVKGATKLHPDIPESMRGTYAGLGHPAFIDHLKQLGVTAVELLPVHGHVDDQFLHDRGLRNYWGYNSIAFLAPDPTLAASKDPLGQVTEFREMVRALHREGIEILLDVVYNHTAEGDQFGPTLCFRGIDNVVYYRLTPDMHRMYDDVTGCGNTINARHPAVIRLILDSLRYWVTEMHVDGFRFDLATALARDPFDFETTCSFLSAVAQDPVLNRVKLIAEPWDLGHNGYQVGAYPVGWSEWNDQFRDSIRSFWLGYPRSVWDFASRVSGSPDLFRKPGRTPDASVNFVTSHDGFTLQDLVSYAERHNEANGDENRDGSSHNLSRNFGVEGSTDDPAILAERSRHRRAMLATLLLSRGVPMILGGDEFRRTQQGNNNAYCQDNETSWFDWAVAKDASDMVEFIRDLAEVRRSHCLLWENTWTEPAGDGPVIADWLAPDGHSIGPDRLGEYPSRAVALHLSQGKAGRTREERCHELLLVFNADDADVEFHLPIPSRPGKGLWVELVDSDPAVGGLAAARPAGASLPVTRRSVRVLRWTEGSPKRS